MTPLDRFNAWLKRTEPDQYGYTPIIVLRKAVELGHTQNEVVGAIQVMRHWLSINENNRKANKKHWAKFILNWLKPKSYQSAGRLEPSDFN